MKYQITTTKDNLYQQYLRAINGVLGLTDKEIAIVAELIVRHLQLPQEMDGLLRSQVLFSAENRKQIQNKMGISQANFNNYIASLRAKNAILESNGYKEVNSNIVPSLVQGRIVISFEFNPSLDEYNN